MLLHAGEEHLVQLIGALEVDARRNAGELAELPREVGLIGVAGARGYAAEDNRSARELFESAAALDPQFALAYAYLAMAVLVEHGYDNAPASIKQRALELALTAVRLSSIGVSSRAAPSNSSSIPNV